MTTLEKPLNVILVLFTDFKTTDYERTSLVLILSLSEKYLEAQDSIQLPASKFHTWISLVNTNLNVKDVLYEVRDTSVVFKHCVLIARTNPQKLTMSNINFNMINIVQIRKKETILHGALYGAIGGGILGGMYGHSLLENIIFVEDMVPNNGSLIAAGGLLGVILGSGIEALVGTRTHRNQFIINGGKRSFIESRTKLKKNSY